MGAPNGGGIGGPVPGGGAESILSTMMPPEKKKYKQQEQARVQPAVSAGGYGLNSKGGNPQMPSFSFPLGGKGAPAVPVGIEAFLANLFRPQI